MTSPFVYTLVINWNGMEHVQACFESLLASDYPNACFVLLDNGSTDGSDRFVEETFGQDPRIEIWRLGENLGWGPGNNAGIRRALESGAAYILLLNNDTWIAPDALTRLVTMAEKNPKAAALAPKMVLFNHPDILNSLGIAVSYIGAAWDIGVGMNVTATPDRHDEIAAVCGGAMFLRASALAATGLLDETFGIYYDDVDLGLRFWQQGYACLQCPEAVVGHKFSASFSDGAGARRKRILSERNRLRFLFLNFPAWLLLRITPFLLLAEARVVGSALRSGQWWQISCQFKAWRALLPQLSEIVRLRRGRFSKSYGDALERLLTWERMFCPPFNLPPERKRPD